MAPNPFHYGTPAEGDYFTGRAEELDALLSRIRNGINVVLISPRRYGKTSLLRVAEGRLRDGKPVAAVIDANVLRATSLAGLVGLLTAGAFRVPGSRWQRARQAVPDFLRRLRVRPVVTFDTGGNPRFGFDAALEVRDAEQVLADVYRLMAEESGHRPAAIVLDEFQAITRLGAWLPDLFKALADEHPAVSLVLAGSQRHLMEELILERQAPLFGMAERLALGPIPDAEMIGYLTQRASAGGRPLDDETAAHLLASAGPVPNDIQHLAFEAFEAAERRIDRAALERGLARAVAHDSALFADRFGRLSGGQARVIHAIAAGSVDAPYSAGFARSVGLANGSSVRKALQPLVRDEEVVVRDGRLAVGDPFFAAWLRAGDDGGRVARSPS